MNKLKQGQNPGLHISKPKSCEWPPMGLTKNDFCYKCNFSSEWYAFVSKAEPQNWEKDYR